MDGYNGKHNSLVSFSQFYANSPDVSESKSMSEIESLVACTLWRVSEGALTVDVMCRHALLLLFDIVHLLRVVIILLIQMPKQQATSQSDDDSSDDNRRSR